MGIFKRKKEQRKSDEDRDLALEQAIQEVLGIKVNNSSKDYYDALNSAASWAAVEIRLKKHPELEKKVMEVYKEIKLKEATPEEYLKIQLEKINFGDYYLKDGVLDINPFIGITLGELLNISKDIIAVVEKIKKVKFKFNEIDIEVDENTNIQKVIEDYNKKLNNENTDNSFINY